MSIDKTSQLCAEWRYVISSDLNFTNIARNIVWLNI